MLIIALLTAALVAAFVSGLCLGTVYCVAVRRAYRNVRTALRYLLARRVSRGTCDCCHHRGLIVDATIADGSGGCTFCWLPWPCQRRMDREHRERMKRLAERAWPATAQPAPVSTSELHPDDIPF
jgi:hypothetical protein